MHDVSVCMDDVPLTGLGCRDQVGVVLRCKNCPMRFCIAHVLEQAIYLLWTVTGSATVTWADLEKQASSATAVILIY